MHSSTSSRKLQLISPLVKSFQRWPMTVQFARVANCHAAPGRHANDRPEEVRRRRRGTTPSFTPRSRLLWGRSRREKKELQTRKTLAKRLKEVEKLSEEYPRVQWWENRIFLRLKLFWLVSKNRKLNLCKRNSSCNQFKNIDFWQF